MLTFLTFFTRALVIKKGGRSLDYGATAFRDVIVCSFFTIQIDGGYFFAEAERKERYLGNKGFGKDFNAT